MPQLSNSRGLWGSVPCLEDAKSGPGADEGPCAWLHKWPCQKNIGYRPWKGRELAGLPFASSCASRRCLHLCELSGVAQLCVLLPDPMPKSLWGSWESPSTQNLEPLTSVYKDLWISTNIYINPSCRHTLQSAPKESIQSENNQMQCTLDKLSKAIPNNWKLVWIFQAPCCILFCISFLSFVPCKGKRMTKP